MPRGSPGKVGLANVPRGGPNGIAAEPLAECHWRLRRISGFRSILRAVPETRPPAIVCPGGATWAIRQTVTGRSDRTSVTAEMRHLTGKSRLKRRTRRGTLLIAGRPPAIGTVGPALPASASGAPEHPPGGVDVVCFRSQLNLPLALQFELDGLNRAGPVTTPTRGFCEVRRTVRRSSSVVCPQDESRIYEIRPGSGRDRDDLSSGIRAKRDGAKVGHSAD